MKEDFLQYIWKYGKFDHQELITVQGEPVEVISPGEHNLLSGPDFFNARIRIGSQLWAGNVEIHLRSSDWYKHRHEVDRNYENVILHVVYEFDSDVFDKQDIAVPCLELYSRISSNTLGTYKNLLSGDRQFINCERNISALPDILLIAWKERLYVERLEKKALLIEEELQSSLNDWEAVLFKLLFRAFGLNINGDSFYSLAVSVDFNSIRKLFSKRVQMEALFFGLSGFLNDEIYDEYYIHLQKEFEFLRNKLSLGQPAVTSPNFFRLRPKNFPTIRISQFCGLYNKQGKLFERLIQAESLKEFYNIFSISAGPYWNDHYTFGKLSAVSTKKLSKDFIDLLLINTIVPLKFAYLKSRGSSAFESILCLMQLIKAEENAVSRKFEEVGIIPDNAMESQSMLQMYHYYCVRNKCLQCIVGNYLIKQ